MRPARPAGDPETTPGDDGTAPAGTPLAAALPADMICTPRNAVAPMCTVAEEVPASIWSAIDSAWLIGIAKAWVCWPDWNCEPARTRRC